MSFEEFVALVAAMRAAQRDYFKHRRSGDLERSKTLERDVDREIVRFGDRQGVLWE